MNVIDIAILALVGLHTVLGIRRGFVRGLFDLVGVAGALLVAALYYRRLIDPLADLGLARSTAAVIAFAGLNVVAQFVMFVITGVVLRPGARSRLPWPVRWGNGLLGVLPGVVKGIALAAVIVIPLAFLQQPAALSAQVRSSRLADPLVERGLDLLYAGTARWNVDLTDFAAITSRPAEGSIDLPFTVTEGLTVDRSVEREMLQLINRERAEAGLDALAWDEELAEVGRSHGDEMFRRGYFSHDSPTTGSPGDRIGAAGIQALTTGENLAYAPSLRVAHEGLMDSPGHRANILHPSFTRVGIGVIRSEDRGLMFVQEFGG